MIQPYTSYTSGPAGKLLPTLQRHGWGQLISASRSCRPVLDPYCIDNGAWVAHTRGEEWNAARFEGLVGRYGEGAAFIVAPDIVAGGLASLERSLEWVPHLPGTVLIAVQDGMTLEDVRPHVGGRVGIFVGGTFEWKWGTVRLWGQLATEVGCHLHVARVNSARRIYQCKMANADSFDGNCPVQFPANIPKLVAAMNQSCLWSDK